jgi:fumarate hydratase class I
MAEFRYEEPFPTAKEETPWRKVASDLVSVATFEGQEVLKVAPEALTLVAREAFRDVAFLYRPGHLAQLAAILDDPEASDNDRGVALALLRNAEVAAGFVLPMCQDTGTATIIGKKGHRVWTGGHDEEHLSRGVFETYTKENLRYSQTLPLTMYDEANSGTNLPAQVDIYATDGMEYRFLMIAKGGGSANKTFLFQETKALLNPAGLVRYLTEKMKTLGTAACPPYHLAFVIGGTSAEATLKAVKLASAKALDGLPTTGSKRGRPGSARSSAASTSPWTCGSCACRGTGPPARSAWGSPARPTATSSPGSTARASGWSSSRGTPAGSSPSACAASPSGRRRR